MKLTKLLTQQFTRIGLAAVLLSTLNLQLSTARAQGTAFSYQGRLDSGGGLANGSYDLTFTMFNATNDGTSSGTVAKSGVPVNNGLFTVTLDFGSSPYISGAAQWLEIAVRTNGAGAFSTLAPRQALQSTPYAYYAYAVNASSLIGQVTDANLAATFFAPHSFTHPGSSFTGNGSGLTALNASQLTSGSVADARLSTNVALRAGSNIFSGHQTITGGSLLRVTDGTTNGNIELQTLAGAGSGYQSINFNGDFNGGEFRYNTSKTRYRIVADHRGATDGFYIDTWDGAAQRLLFTGLPNGNVGIGTPTPNFPLSFPDSNGEKISLWGQDRTLIHGLGIGGARMEFYVPQTTHAFDFGVGNHTNFAVKMRISGNGNVGIGTTSPNAAAKLDVAGQIRSTGGGTYIEMHGASGGGCINTGGGDLLLNDAVAGNILLGTGGGKVGINKGDPSSALDVTGECKATVFTPTSDRNAKQDFTPVNPREVLEKVVALPITEWTYRNIAGARHMGPVAQDFRAAFGLGSDDKGISTVDADGVALASIQALNQKLNEKDAEVQELKQSVEELKELVRSLARKQ